MINEKKLIEAIRKVQDNLYFTNIYCDRTTLEGISSGLDNAISIIDKQQKVGEWIPCSERLPECDVKVLVTIKIDGMYVLDIAERWENELESGWFYTDEWFDVTLSDINVIAWQPLPQPYKGD